MLLLSLIIQFSLASPCKANKNYIDVDTKQSKLRLCAHQKIEKEYSVSFGRGGFGKTATQDGKTPLGNYPLGEPRGSKRFYIFIPIGYPTPAEVKKGYTGRDVGLHGPDKKFAWLKKINTWVNWTNGCIAVSSKEEIDEIANWVKKEKASTIVIY
jgi:murein L,D-transpeptidase YafK